MLIHRRKLITGLISLVAAPAIVQIENIMPVKAVIGLTKEEMINQAILRLEDKVIHTFGRDVGHLYLFKLWNDQFIVTAINEAEIYK